MSGEKEQKSERNFDNAAYSDGEESEIEYGSERGISKMSNVSAESGIASGSSPRLSEDSRVTESPKDSKSDTKGSSLTGFVGYMASRLSPKKRRQGDTSSESPKDNSPKKSSVESKSPKSGSSSSGFIKKVQAGIKGISDLMPGSSKGKDAIVDAVDQEENIVAAAVKKIETQTIKRKSPTKKEIKRMLQEKSSTETSKSEPTQSTVADSDPTSPSSGPVSSDEVD